MVGFGVKHRRVQTPAGIYGPNSRVPIGIGEVNSLTEKEFILRGIKVKRDARVAAFYVEVHSRVVTI